MTTNSNSEEGGLSSGALSGMVILGLIATLMAMTVVFILIYMRYGTIRKPHDQERIPLIPDNE